MVKKSGKCSAYNSPYYFFFIVLSISGIEAFVMVSVGFLPFFPRHFYTVYGPSLLFIIIIPVIYFFVFRPLQLQIAVRERAKKEWEETFDNLTDALYIHDRQFRIVRANKAFQELAGIPFAEIIGKPYYNIFPKMDKPFNVCIKALKSEKPEELEAEEISLPSLNKIFRLRAYSVNKINKKYVHFVHIFEDITEHRQAEKQLETYKLLFSEIHDLAYVFDTQGNILFVNKIFEKLTNHKPEDFTGKPFAPLFDDENLKKVMDVYTRTLKGEFPEYELSFKDTGILCEYKNVPYRDEGKSIIGVIGTARDITKRNQIKQRLRIQYATASVLAESTTENEAIPAILRDVSEYMKWDIGEFWAINKEKNVLQMATCWCKESVNFQEFLAYSQQVVFPPGIGLPGRVWLSGKPLWIADINSDTNFPRAPTADRAGLHGAIAFPALNESEVLGVIGFFSREIKQPDKELLDMLHALGSQIGQFIKKAEVVDMLKHIAYHDTLTNLPNRMLFQDRLRVAMHQAKRNKQSVAVVLIDLDDFKDVNDTLGHFAGDSLLKDVTKRLKRCTRESDTVARMGGDEFVFILQNIKHIRDAENVIQKILKALDSPFKINGHEIRTSASIGASLYPQDTDDPEILLEYADIAMYQSKKDGKSTYRFYTATNK